MAFYNNPASFHVLYFASFYVLPFFKFICFLLVLVSILHDFFNIMLFSLVSPSGDIISFLYVVFAAIGRRQPPQDASGSDTRCHPVQPSG